MCEVSESEMDDEVYLFILQRECEGERERERGGTKEAFYLVLRNFANQGFRSTQLPIIGVVVVTVFYSEIGQGSEGEGELYRIC